MLGSLVYMMLLLKIALSLLIRFPVSGTRAKEWMVVIDRALNCFAVGAHEKVRTPLAGTVLSLPRVRASA